MTAWYLFASTAGRHFKMTGRGRVAVWNRRVTSWIAAVALVFSALAPALAQAVAGGADRAAPWADICTSAGMPQGAGPTSSDENPLPDGIKHCPWCTGGGHASVLLSANYSPAIGSRGEESSGEFRQPSFIRLTLRGKSQPRAPPINS